MDANAIKAAYPGYSSWNDPAAIMADFKATGGSGKGGGGGGNGFDIPHVSAQDITSAEDQVYQQLKPYYLKLAQQAQGDYGTAVKLLNADYTQGVRNAKVNYAFTESSGLQGLQNTLKTLGVSNAQDQGKTIDDLNKRGMAVGQQSGPGGSFNALRQSQINANNPSSITPGQPINFSSTVATPANPNTGYGAYELGQLQNSQQLRQEAEQRSALKPIEESGIKLKQYTNTPAGFNSANPSASLSSLTPEQLSSLGTAESGLVKGSVDATQQARNRQQDLQQQLQQNVLSLGTGIAQSGVKEAGNIVGNAQNKVNEANFVTVGNS